MNYQIFLDLDGVIVDFLGGVAKWYGTDKKIEDHWPRGCYGDTKVMSAFYEVPFHEVWEGLNQEFWENLDFLPQASYILSELAQFKPVILTKPATGRGCATGKQLWIKNYLPDYWKDRRYFIGGRKELIAGPGRILLDDDAKNIDAWIKAGGFGLLVPAHWNKYWNVPLNSVINTVKMLCTGQLH